MISCRFKISARRTEFLSRKEIHFHAIIIRKGDPDEKNYFSNGIFWNNIGLRFDRRWLGHRGYLNARVVIVPRFSCNRGTIAPNTGTISFGGTEMKLKLAKWCSIIPLFVYAPLIALATLDLVFFYTIFDLVLLFFMVLSIYVMPFLAVLGFVLSLILIFQKERKAIKFLVLSFVDIIILVVMVLVVVNIVHNMS